MERALKETYRVEASIFARRLKLLNFLPSFTANFAPTRKKKVAEGRLGARTPTRTVHCRRQPHGQPHGRQTLNRTILLPTKSPGDPPIVFSTPCQMGNFATASRRESDPFPPTRSRGVQRDSLGPRSQNRPRLGLDQVARNSNLRLGEPPLRGDRHNPARKWENNNNNHIRYSHCT